MLLLLVMTVAAGHGNARLLLHFVPVAEVGAVASLGVVGVELSALTAYPFHGMPVTRLVQIFSALFRNSTSCFQLGSSLKTLIPD
jgi:hypothetical protein